MSIVRLFGSKNAKVKSYLFQFVETIANFIRKNDKSEVSFSHTEVRSAHGREFDCSTIKINLTVVDHYDAHVKCAPDQRFLLSLGNCH